jgi:hypothetical protein
MDEVLSLLGLSDILYTMRDMRSALRNQTNVHVNEIQYGRWDTLSFPGGKAAEAWS